MAWVKKEVVSHHMRHITLTLALRWGNSSTPYSQVRVPGQGKIAIFWRFQLFQDEMQDYEWVRKVGMVRSLTHKLVLIYTIMCKNDNFHWFSSDKNSYYILTILHWTLHDSLQFSETSTSGGCHPVGHQSIQHLLSPISQHHHLHPSFFSYRQ